ncbi:MAG: carbohydrate-binding domain-containing protein [Ignavibacteriales bacterium]|nr:MAG: carbohydrate-binding domain-containing protein [Ignavibacteriales bacterium]
MKKQLIILLWLALNTTLLSQEKIYIHKSDNITLGASLSAIDSFYFSHDGALIYLSVGDTTVQYSLSEIDSISFDENSDTVLINYNDSDVSVMNPFAYEGVSVNVNGASVTIKAGEDAKNVTYKLAGTTADGSFKVYSEKKFNLLLGGINITNTTGPAINIQAGKKISVVLADGTNNILTDGSSYADSLVIDSVTVEEQDAAFFCEGSLIFSGNGALTVNGKGSLQHAICSDDLIQIDGGNIIVTSAAKDGLNANDGIVITNGSLNITSNGDAIDGGEGYVDISGGEITTINSVSNTDGISCDSTITISNGTLNMTLSGDQSKGLKSGMDMILSGGSITINTTGNAVLETYGSGYNPSYCTAIKSDSSIFINGGEITITSSGKGGKGISADSNVIITGGIVKIATSGAGATYKNSSNISDAYNATCITANGNIVILGGNITTSSSGSAGKGITADGSLTFGDSTESPEINITTTGAKITISGSGMNTNTAEAKAISCNGAVTINSGKVTISSADDGIKSSTAVILNNGTTSITKSVEGIEAPLIKVNNGVLSIAASDDGFNATKGNGGEFNDGSYLYLNGGNIEINVTKGDGLDSNGNIVMTSGTVVVHGPQSQPEVGTDYNGTFVISGGLLFVTGPNSGNMIQATSTSSTQYALKVTTNSSLNSSTLFCIQDASGNNLVIYKTIRNVYYVVFSSPELKSGSTYYIYTGGTTTGTYSNGLYVGGTYSGGTLKKSFTVSGKVTSVSF